MDNEQAINIAKGCVMASYMDNETKQAVIEVLDQVAISKTETTSCEWCEKVGKYAQFDFATYTEVDGDKEYEYAVKVNYCPNCGRKLKGE